MSQYVVDVRRSTAVTVTTRRAESAMKKMRQLPTRRRQRLARPRSRMTSPRNGSLDMSTRARAMRKRSGSGTRASALCAGPEVLIAQPTEQITERDDVPAGGSALAVLDGSELLRRERFVVARGSAGLGGSRRHGRSPGSGCSPDCHAGNSRRKLSAFYHPGGNGCAAVRCERDARERGPLRMIRAGSRPVGTHSLSRGHLR